VYEIMSAKISLNTTPNNFDDLIEIVNKARKNAKSVKVDRKLLINLLMDHSLLISSLNDLGVRDIENG
jgi:hypothetical protein